MRITSIDGGANFTGATIVDAGASNIGIGLQIIIDSNNNPHIVFRQSDGSNFRIYHNYSQDGGVSFAGAILVDAGAGNNAANPQMVIDSNNNPHVVFRQIDGPNGRIYYNYSSDGGANFVGATLIDAGAGDDAYEPQIVIGP